MHPLVNNLRDYSYLCKLNVLNMALTGQQIERQDFVDNAIFNLFNLFVPSNKEKEWDIEVIGEIRDAIKTKLVE